MHNTWSRPIGMYVNGRYYRCEEAPILEPE